MSVISLRPTFDLSDPKTLKLDLENLRPKEVLALVEAFEADIKAKPEPQPLPFKKNGWYDVTPEIAVQLLRRNLPGANRKIDPGTVFYYAQQMAHDKWVPTGQPFLLDKDGKLQDAQHRLYAVVISGVTIHTYIVLDVPPRENLFAYIDNTRSRTAATALQTAGYNGVSSVIAAVIRIGEEVEHGIYNPTGATKLPRMSPADVLALVTKYPLAKVAARSAASDWDDVVKLVSKRRMSAVAYLGMRIMELYGDDRADEFFADLVDESERAADDPIAAFRKEVKKDLDSKKPMRPKHLLGALIKTFNAWNKNESLGRRWMLQVNEDFPEIDRPDTAIAAE